MSAEVPASVVADWLAVLSGPKPPHPVLALMNGALSAQQSLVGSCQLAEVLRRWVTADGEVLLPSRDDTGIVYDALKAGAPSALLYGNHVDAVIALANMQDECRDVMTLFDQSRTYEEQVAWRDWALDYLIDRAGGKFGLGMKTLTMASMLYRLEGNHLVTVYRWVKVRYGIKAEASLTHKRYLELEGKVRDEWAREWDGELCPMMYHWAKWLADRGEDARGTSHAPLSVRSW